MFSKMIWNSVMKYNGEIEPQDYFIAILGCIWALPLDILFSPIELIAILIYRWKEG